MRTVTGSYARVAGLLRHRQCPAVCIGSMPPSLSQPDAPKIDRGRLGERQLDVVRAAACARLDVRPLLIAVETHSGGRPARSGYPSRPPALAVRPPVAFRLPGHRAGRIARPTCGLPLPAAAFEPRCIVATSRVGMVPTGWLQLPLLHRERRGAPWREPLVVANPRKCGC
jgi:hypothetical protein